MRSTPDMRSIGPELNLDFSYEVTRSVSCPLPPSIGYSPSQGYPLALNLPAPIVPLSTPIWVTRGTMRVKCVT